MDAQALRERTTRARDQAGQDGWAGAWSQLAEELYRLDAGFQDDLYAAAISSAAAYQLGRLLGEVTWALDPAAKAGSSSLSFLLSPERVSTGTRLLQRLRQNIDEVTAVAIAASLERWGTFASTGGRAVDQGALEALREQARAWHDLLLDQVPWQTLVTPKDALKRRPSLAPLRPFWFELVVGSVGLAGLILALGLLSIRGQGAGAAILAVASASGVTVATVRARLKDQAQNLLGQMKRAFDLELAAEAVLCPPPDHQ